jgi:hypothetical protein
MSTENFYSELPQLSSLMDITDPANFRPVPADWLIVVTDVRNSTQAIQDGRYKDINLVGACSIVSILNIAGRIEIPFIFGGDGATVLIPPSLIERTAQALRATRRMAARAFNLDLRVGMIPTLALEPKSLQIAKLKLSEFYSQAVMRGGGLSHATDLLKQNETDRFYRLDGGTAEPEADYTGLECRWQDIPSRFGEMLSIIVETTSTDEARADATLREVIARFLELYGHEAFHPIALDGLKLTFNRAHLLRETRVLTSHQSRWRQELYLWKLRWLNVLGAFLMKTGMRTGDTDWGGYKNDLIASTDYQKFDDALRMVISSTTSQREELEDFLAKQWAKGNLVYGIHVSDRALMTCLVFERNGRQVHFIDGADGGYAQAAKVLKSRIHNKSQMQSPYKTSRHAKPCLDEPR